MEYRPETLKRSQSEGPSGSEASGSKASQSKADELEERLIDFAVRIIRLTSTLPRTSAGKHIAGQILRSGTSPAPNYGEARGAESSADFVHNLGVVLKELNETFIWLRVIERSEILRRELLSDISEDNKELCKIIGSSLRTAWIRRKYLIFYFLSSIFYLSFGGFLFIGPSLRK